MHEGRHGPRLKGRLLADLGAYLYFGTAEIPTLTTLMGTGPYLFTDLQYDLYGVFTNKVPTDAFRGAGRPEATYFQERMMDAIADDLGLDAADVRKTQLHQEGPVSVHDADRA